MTFSVAFNKYVRAVLSLIVLISASGCVEARALHSEERWVKSIIVQKAESQGLPVSLALAVARVESNFDPRALSHAGARGVMQIMPATAEKTLGVSRHQLYDPKVNIEAGIRFLKRLIDTYDGRIDIALSHYNGGSAVNQSGRLRVIPATRRYVNKVCNWCCNWGQCNWGQDQVPGPLLKVSK